MPKGTRASPGTGKVGHNSGLPDHAAVRKALAVEMIFEEEKRKLNERHKRARKKMQGDGIVMDDLADLKALRDKTGTEIVDTFRRRWHLAGALHPDKWEQLDLFVSKSDAPTRAAHYTMGLMQGLKGLDLEVPPMVVGDDRQQMIDGHNEGRQLHADASKSLLAEALDPKNEGKVADGTPGAVNARAAEDFAKDNADDPLVVNGEKYATVRQANAARSRLQAQQEQAKAGAGDEAGEDEPKPLWHDFPEDNTSWTGSQREAFQKWFDSQPQDVEIAPDDFEHPGAAAECSRLLEKAVGGPPGSSPPSTATGSSESTNESGPTTTTDASTATSSTESQSTGEGYLNDPEPRLGDDVKVPAPSPPPRPHVPRPDFHSWDDDFTKWSGPQTMEFRRWFDSLPVGTIPPITHPGAVDAFNELRAANWPEARPAGMSDEEWEKARPQPQRAETPDPEEVAAAAKKLEESGFTASAKKSTRSRKPPATR